MATAHELERYEHAHSVDPALQENINAYCAQLDSLLTAHHGDYVVFANSHLYKICKSLESALTEAYAAFGASPFLVQRIEPLRSRVDFHATCRV